MSKITFSDEGWEDYLYWQSEDKKILKKINKLIKDITRDPFNGIGKPEPLKKTYQDIGAEELTIKIDFCIL